MKIPTDLQDLAKNSLKTGFKWFLRKVLLYVVLAFVAISALFKAWDYASARYACHTQWVESDIEYKYTLRGGCLLKLENGWLPAKNYRVQ